MTNGKRSVVVVGCGGAGIAALAAFDGAGFEVRGLERGGEIGGVWATTRYPGLTIHSKSFNYRFHDFPSVSSLGESATREEIRTYFDDYVRAKGIEGSIALHQRVERITHRPHLSRRRCKVLVTDTRDGNTAELESDVVVCATGYSNAGRPHVPELDGAASSGVRVVHSSRFTGDLLEEILTRRLKVVVLGAGKSAQEIIWLFRRSPRLSDLTWVYSKALWSLQYEKLYADTKIPWNVFWYLYYLGLAEVRGRLGYGAVVKLLQTPLRRSGLLINPLEPAPDEPDSDISMNRSAIIRGEQVELLRRVRAVRGAVRRLGHRSVVLEDGEEFEADVLVCATGYDRRADLPTVVVEDEQGETTPHDLGAQPGFYQHMVDPGLLDVSLLAANVLYPQQLLGYSLGAQWLARFHAGTLARPPSRAQMADWVARHARRYSPWASGRYLSGGQPYAHERDEAVLPSIFVEMGLSRLRALNLVTSGADPAKFGSVCDGIASALAQDGRGK